MCSVCMCVCVCSVCVCVVFVSASYQVAIEILYKPFLYSATSMLPVQEEEYSVSF